MSSCVPHHWLSLGNIGDGEILGKEQEIIQCSICGYSVDLHSVSEFKGMDIVDIVRGNCHGR
jgi:hypothetical protein